MNAPTKPDIYDENSVFRKLFADETPLEHTPQVKRLERVMKDTPKTEAPIVVADFLPQI